MKTPRDLSAADIPRLTAAAIAAGHEPTVDHVGKRFRLACTCGFATRTRDTRKEAFQKIADHVAEVGLLALSGESPDTPSEVPVVVGGRA